MAQLEGKTALVTGAASGIGLGISKLFASEGAKVIMADVSPLIVQEAKSICEKGLWAYPDICDISISKQVQEVIRIA
ncbi:MAG: SDR family NAD(P)-dependent oxidoreductase, partial [Synergistaceae bacterium]|nr:SDR family NAD(P)-dependent oxidoreductase [Synergistaceae bacterium]